MNTNRHTRRAEAVYSEYWNAWTVEAGATGIMVDDGRARWSADATEDGWLDEATARKIMTRANAISELVWAYQTSRRRNPAEFPIRLRFAIGDGDAWIVTDYDYGQPVGTV